MPNNTDSIPFNPFITPNESIDPSQIVELPFLDIAFTADGLEREVGQLDWTPIELQAIRDAANFVRWAAHISGLSEADVIRNRLNNRGNLSLLLREAADDKKEE